MILTNETRNPLPFKRLVEASYIPNSNNHLTVAPGRFRPMRHDREMTLRGEGISFEFLRTLPPCLVFGGDINAALKSNALGAHEVAGVLTGGVRGITSTSSSLPPKAAVTGEETTARFEGESPSWSLTENSEPSGYKSVWSSCTLSSISKVRLNSSISFVCSTSHICSEVVKIAALSTQSARVSDSVGSTEIAASCTSECTPTAERSTGFSTVSGSTDSGVRSSLFQRHSFPFLLQSTIFRGGKGIQEKTFAIEKIRSLTKNSAPLLLRLETKQHVAIRLRNHLAFHLPECDQSIDGSHARKSSRKTAQQVEIPLFLHDPDLMLFKDCRSILWWTEFELKRGINSFL
nr:hypothetical protein Iba_chr09fCG11020 [Ipomoea batatas]